MPASSLYFIAIIPPEPVSLKLLDLKEQVASRFDSKAALRSPPHITLHMPFDWPDRKLSRLQNALTSGFSKDESYTIKLNGFGSFPPRVIFVKVEPNPRLSQMQKDLCQLMAEKLSLYNANYRNRPFHPHITIAFRDLKKARYFEAWDYYQHLEFQADFRVNRLTLLKHNGRIWEQEMHFNLASGG